jgi:spermidine/putrescine-binding protein
MGGEISLRDDSLSRFANTALDIDTNVTTILSNDSSGFEETIDRMGELNSKVSTYWGSGAQAIRLLREGNVPVAEI